MVKCCKVIVRVEVQNNPVLIEMVENHGLKNEQVQILVEGLSCGCERTMLCEFQDWLLE